MAAKPNIILNPFGETVFAPHLQLEEKASIIATKVKRSAEEKADYAAFKEYYEKEHEDLAEAVARYTSNGVVPEIQTFLRGIKETAEKNATADLTAEFNAMQSKSLHHVDNINEAKKTNLKLQSVFRVLAAAEKKLNGGATDIHMENSVATLSTQANLIDMIKNLADAHQEKLETTAAKVAELREAHIAATLRHEFDESLSHGFATQRKIAAPRTAAFGPKA